MEMMHGFSHSVPVSVHGSANVQALFSSVGSGDRHECYPSYTTNNRVKWRTL